MAKIILAGDAVCIQSTIAYEDYELVEKYRPDALKLKDEDGNEVFKVSVGCCADGGFSKYGVTFNGKSHDGAGLATVTELVCACGVEDIKEAIAEYVGTAILDLNKVEAQIPAALEEIKAERANILANIEVAG